jgi:hypothetical protein
MNKSIALLALLLPFSGYAITKKERKQEILAEIKDLYAQTDHMVKLMENNLFFAALFPTYFSDMAKKIDARGEELNKELDQINLELK